jgi:hypothetical protein
MSRPEARTMSQTMVEINAESIRLKYSPVGEDRFGEPTAVTLSLSNMAAAAVTSRETS